VSKRLRLTREDGADTAFVHLALLSGAITVSEFIGWTERIVTEADDGLPDYIYEIAALNKQTATLMDLRDALPNVTGDVSPDEDKILMAISVIRNPVIAGRTDEPRPLNSRSALKRLEAHPDAKARFDAFFPGILP